MPQIRDHPIKAWVTPDRAPFYSSPYSRRSLWPTADIKDRKQKQKSVGKISVVKIIATSDFILLLIWVAIGNLDCIFANFSFAQFSQYVQEDYKGLLIRNFQLKKIFSPNRPLWKSFMDWRCIFDCMWTFHRLILTSIESTTNGSQNYCYFLVCYFLPLSWSRKSVFYVNVNARVNQFPEKPEKVIRGLQYARSPTSVSYFSIIFPAYKSLLYSLSAVKGCPLHKKVRKFVSMDTLSQFTFDVATR